MQIIDELKLTIIPYVDDETELLLKNVRYWRQIRGYIRNNLIKQIKYEKWQDDYIPPHKLNSLTKYNSVDDSLCIISTIKDKKRMYDWYCDNCRISILRIASTDYNYKYFKLENIYDYVELYLSIMENYVKAGVIIKLKLSVGHNIISLNTDDLINTHGNLKLKPGSACDNGESYHVHSIFYPTNEKITKFIKYNAIANVNTIDCKYDYNNIFYNIHLNTIFANAHTIQKMIDKFNNLQ